MKTTLLATNIELDDSSKDYLDKKMKAVEKLVDPADSSAFGALEIERTTRHHRKGIIFRAEINLHTADYGNMRAEGFGETVFEAIDEMKDDVTRKLRTAKGKLVTKKLKGGREIKHRVADKF